MELLLVDVGVVDCVTLELDVPVSDPGKKYQRAKVPPISKTTMIPITAKILPVDAIILASRNQLYHK